MADWVVLSNELDVGVCVLVCDVMVSVSVVRGEAVNVAEKFSRGMRIDCSWVEVMA